MIINPYIYADILGDFLLVNGEYLTDNEDVILTDKAGNKLFCNVIPLGYTYLMTDAGQFIVTEAGQFILVNGIPFSFAVETWLEGTTVLDADKNYFLYKTPQ